MRCLLTVACLLLFSPAGLAQPRQPELRVMMCEIIDESGTGWVPDFLMLTRQTEGPQAGRIEVFDPILKDLVRRPIKAVVTADDRQSRSYGWALGKVRNHSGQYAERLDFRLRVSKADGSATLLVTAEGYANRMTGAGQCVSPSE
ncbi:hypothetical protein [Paracoccus ravus]|uniref:hypothetical protein n=1 Tax=Paracoccus ravus TaxID=2447760 RepID=UPI00106E252A|nr:hypothetical protein [Paracoccus ravus]